MVFNGKAFIKEAFKFLENRLHPIYDLDDPTDQLAAIWKLVLDKYAKSNQVIVLKQKLQQKK